jgi:GT2 family glycosyltransferase
MKNEQPLVTINILSFNRKDELRNTLQKVFEQDYKNIEVIVVDNASTDGSSKMVKEEFPEVKLIKMEKNIGIAGWNEGFFAAKGEYVLVLDDDAYPAEDSITFSISEFINNYEVACIAFNLIDINSGEFYKCDWIPQNKSKKIFWPVFVGCAFIVRVDRLPNEFKFPESYFVYQHELPMSAEIYIHNKKILFVPDIHGFHNFKEIKEYKVFNDSHLFKNNLNFICAYLPMPLMILYYLQCILFFISRSIRHGWLSTYIEFLLNNKFFMNRKKISLQYFFQLRSLHLFNLPLLSKIFK